MSKLKKLDIELLIFLFCLFFQNFAIIRTSSFGISVIVLFLIYAFFRYKFYKELSKKFILFVITTIIFILISSKINNIFNIFQIVRYFLCVFVAYTSYFYIKNLIKNDKTEKLLNYSLNFCLILCIYGIYQVYASRNHWPMFLNVFNNNPSYAVRGIFEVYGGWVSFDRVYTTFFEPSIYAVFLVNLLFIFIMFKEKDERTKFKLRYTIFLMLINLFLTFSRAGWVIFVCYLGIFIYYKLFSKYKIMSKIGKIMIINLPFIILATMYFIGLIMFSDQSSLTRTYSSLFYLVNSFKKVIFVLFGHGLNVMSFSNYCVSFQKVFIEPFAHNGYIEIAYQFGWLYLLYLLFVVNRFIDKGLKKFNWFPYAAVVSVCCFGAIYNVDSLTTLIVMIICLSKFYNRSEV